MFSIFINLFSVLDKSEKRTIYNLQFLFIFGALVELLSVFSIIPYIYFLSSEASLSDLFGEYNLNFLDDRFFFEKDPKIIFGIFLFILISISNFIQFISNYLIIKFSNKLGKNFQMNLFDKYINLEFFEYQKTENSDLKQNIIQEGSRIVPGVIMPLLNINSKIFNILIIVFLLISQFSIIIFIIIGAMFLYYFLIYKYFKNKTANSGEIISTSAKKYLRYMDFAFSNFILTKLNFLENFFSNKINLYISQHIKAVNFVQIISLLPKYIIEIFMFGGLIAISIFLYYSGTQNLIPKLGFLAFAAYRLVPSFNMIYNNFVLLNANKIALTIYKESINKKSVINKKVKKRISITKIEAKNLSYSYGNLEIFKNLNFIAKKGQIIGIKGKSGSGKSTLFKVLVGLDKSFSGKININDKHSNIDLYRHIPIGFVGQDPRTFDEDFIYNITSNSSIIHNDIQNLIQSIGLDEMKNENIFDLKVKENGDNLSGGQIRRLMLAHALYKKPEIIFLDETFSSLDKKLENKILNNIRSINKDLIVFIISHNNETLKKCDIVINLDE